MMSQSPDRQWVGFWYLTSIILQTRFLSFSSVLFPRAMSSTKRIQGKLFRGESGGDSGPDPAKPGSLTIDIPTNALQTKSVQPLKVSRPTEGVEIANDVPEGRYTIPYRDRLLRSLGNEYCGAERYRLEADRKKEAHWKKWGPYLSDRQWVHLPRLHSIEGSLLTTSLSIQATVREDYSHNGDAWSHFPHEHARSRAYRWGEDGIAGISDNHQRVCLALSLWNGEDRILKERLFGVTGHQGNHGEDVKELYWYLDSTPTHSYMKFLYKYPQRAFPYEQLVKESQTRGRDVPEYEILDTDAFDDNRYWDVFVEVCVSTFYHSLLGSPHPSTQKTRKTLRMFTPASPLTTEGQIPLHYISFLSSGSPIPGLGQRVNNHRLKCLLTGTPSSPSIIPWELITYIVSLLPLRSIPVTPLTSMTPIPWNLS
jgi:hypothetical protein